MDIYILRDGKQIGPFSEETTHQMLKQGVVYINDPAWRPGMPEWLPLHSVLFPAPPSTASTPIEHAPALPVPAAEPAEMATEKQKAFLRYFGLPFSASLTKEQAEALVNDAMEDPKNASRVARWNDERLTLHPSLFAAEIQEKKAGRPERFYELCQTEGAEALEGVTKAHCQVIVGYLDSKFPNWDAGKERDAAWNYFFPAIAEKLPQLVRSGWKEKLQYPQNTAAVPDPKRRGVPATPVRASVPKRKPSSPIASLFKGLAFGLLIVGLGVGGLYVYKNPQAVAQAKEQLALLQAKYLKKDKTTAQKPAAQPATTPEVPPLSSNSPAGTQNTPAPEAMKPAAETKTPDPAPMAGTTPAAEAGMMANAPAPAPAPELPEASATPNSSSMSLFDPTPTPPAGTKPEDPAASGLPAPKTTVTLLQTMELQLTYGKIKVPAGTQLPIVEQDGASVKVKFQNQVVSVPVAATDLGGAGLAQ